MAELSFEELPEFFDDDPSRPFDINYSKQLDVHRWSDYPEVNKFVDHIHDTYIKDKYRFLSTKKKCLKVLLLDLYVNWLEDPNRLLGFSRRLSAYNSTSRYNKLHISRTIIEVQDALSDLGLVDHKLGWPDLETGIRRNTKVWPTQKLIKEFEEARVERLDIRLDIQSYDEEARLENVEVIVQQKTEKDEFGRDVKIRLEYKDTPNVEDMRSLMHEYNALLQHHHIDLCNTDYAFVRHREGNQNRDLIDPDTGKETFAHDGYGGRKYKTYVNQDNLVYRVFNNGSWKQGGRFYGGFWQQIPREYRRHIRIDGFPTVEVDYRSHHPVLLYARKGVNYWKEHGPDNDPYDLSDQFIEINKWRGYEVTVGGAVATGGLPNEYNLMELERQLIKTLMLCMVNSKSDIEAIKASRKDIRAQNGDQWNHFYNSLTNEVMEPYVKAIRMKHKPIRDYLSQGKSLGLQFLDSQITEELVDYFTRKGIPILTVHDSYVIPEAHVQDLRRQMSRIWNKHSGLNNRGVTVDWEAEYLARMGDGSTKLFKSKSRMPAFVPTKEIHPLSKRKQYVSKRYRDSLKEFQKWRKREDIQDRMESLGLLYHSKMNHKLGIGRGAMR